MAYCELGKLEVQVRFLAGAPEFMIIERISGSYVGPLWEAYSEIDYGRLVPEKNYKGFRTFIRDVSGCSRIEGTTLGGFVLEFDNEEDFIVYKLKYGSVE